MARENVYRRLAAILNADVVGYSRRMGINETGTLSALRRSHGGGRDGLTQHERQTVSSPLLRNTGAPENRV